MEVMTGTARDVSNLHDVSDGITYEVRQEQVAIEEDKYLKSVDCRKTVGRERLTSRYVIFIGSMMIIM